MILTFRDHLNQMYDERYALLENFTGIDTVMDKITLYQKRELAYRYNVTNENFRYMNKPVQNIYFSTLERESTKELFREFVPRIVESLANELTEAGFEFDESILNELGLGMELNEGLKDRISKALSSLKSKASNVADKVGGVIDNAKEYISDTAEEIKKTTKEAKDKIVEKYKNIIGFISKVIESGANSVKEFISNIAKLFQKIGETVSNALKKLGAFKTPDDEEAAGITFDKALFENTLEDKGEENFVSHVIAYVSVMMGEHKDRVEKLISEGFENVTFDFSEDALNEGKLMDKIANNKFLQFILCYGKDKKISIWRSILISIAGSLIISFGLPVILPVFGLGGAAITTICAAVRIVWSAKGCFKIILNRYVNKKDGEKLFDLKTCILLVVTILPQIPPFKDWIAKAFERLLHALHLDQWIDNLGQRIGKLVEKLHGKDPSLETMTQSYDETILRPGGGRVNFVNYDQNNSDFLAATGATGKELDSLNSLVNCADGANKSGIMTKLVKTMLGKIGGDLHHGFTFDTSTPGQNALMAKAIDAVTAELKADNVTSGTIVGRTLHGATNRIAGAIGIAYNCSDEFFQACKDKFVEMGGDISTMSFNVFGNGIAKEVVTHTNVITKPVNWLFNSIVDSFGLVFIPILDNKYWGKYKMRFASGTRGAAAYVVDEVKDIKSSDISKVGESPALNKLIELHNSTWNEMKSNDDNVVEKTEEVKESKDPEKKEKKDKKKKVEEPRYIAIYVRPNEDTKNKEDKPLEGKKEEKKKGKTFAGVVIDPLTMMVADVCDFNESTKKRRRNQPYFMKGLFSRLSFTPLKKDDNETKDYIRTSLGTTMNTLINICVESGKAKEYIELKKSDDGKKLEYSLKDGVDGKAEVAEMGNLSPDEILTCIKDESKNHKEAYALLDGKYGSKVSIKVDKKTGKSVVSSKRDENTIENVKYIKVEKEDKEKRVEDAKQAVRDWKQNGMHGKKPSVPRFIELPNGDFYKKANKQERESNGDKLPDWVDVKILPLLTDGEKKGKKLDTSLKDELQKDETIKKVLYDGDDKLNDKTVNIIRDFLYRPEKSFAKDDEHELTKKLNDNGIEGENLKWYKKIFKKEEELHNTIKRIIEIIWDYILEERRGTWKKKDNKFNTGPTPESYGDYTLYDQLIEESLLDEDEDDDEEENVEILNESNNGRVLSFEEFLNERY